ncbi:MAG: anaerobic ribonucleoside-triphosphate reductase activating protein [Candidatus Bathyarchaeia archaeon]
MIILNPETRLRVGGITDMSTVDWYGNVSLVVFCAGCNYRCPYCQNSGLIPLDSGREIDLGLLRERFEANKLINDAVVFTGGEPVLQPDAVIEAAKLAKSRGLKVMLDSNGSVKENVDRVLRSGYIDRVALDVKAPINPVDYGRVTGRPDLGEASVAAVEHCLNLSRELGIEMEVRTTVAPGVSDDPAFIRSIANSIKGRCDAYYLQQFDNLGEVLSQTLKREKPPSREAMMSLAREALKTGLRHVFIKTRSNGLERMG